MPNNRSRILDNIKTCDEPAKLRRFMNNARQRGVDDVYDAAFHRLIEVQPSAEIGTVAHDVWRSIYALEELLTEERKKTTRLQRTRQAIERKGEVKTVVDLVLRTTPSQGFNMLRERNLLELSFEALVATRRSDFPEDVVNKASERLESVGWSSRQRDVR